MSGATQEKAPFTVPQPNGESIELNNNYHAVDQFKAVSAHLGKKRHGGVPAHLVAIVAEAANSKGIKNDELAAIASDMHAADTLLREKGSQPIIYQLHCEDAFAVTPEEGTTGFRLVDTNTNPEYSPWIKTAVDTARLYRLRSGGFGRSFSEEGEGVTEGEPLTMHEPLSFLASGFSKDVKRFMEHNPDWKRYPNSEVIVGHGAVHAFLKEQAKKDLLTEAGDLNPSAVVTSWAMLASTGLQRVGYASSIGKRGDLVHRASIEGLAEVIAGGLGYKTYVARQYGGDDEMFVRRIAGVEFDVRADAQSVGERAADKLFSDENRVTSFNGLLYGNQDHVQAYLTEVAGNFIEHAASVR